MINPFANVLFTGAIRLIVLGWRKKLTVDHLRLPSKERTEASYDRFRREWDKELKSGRSSLLLALVRCFWFPFLVAGLFKLLWGVLTVFTASWYVYDLVRFVEDGERFDGEGWVIAATFFVSVLLLSVCLQQMMAFSSRLGIRVRAALMTAVYNKGLRLATTSIVVGDIVGLVANDCSRLYEACSAVHYIWSSSLESLALIGVMVYLLGLPGLAGLGVALLMLPAQFAIGYFITRFRGKSISAADLRVHIVHEILLAIKLVKLYAWERSFDSSVAQVRRREMKNLLGGAHFRSLNLMFVFAVPPVVAFTVFTVYVLAGESLEGDARLTFTVLSLANSLRFPLVVLPKSFRILAESIAALRRVQRFLLKTEVAKMRKRKEVGVRIVHGTFSVPGSKQPILRKIDLTVNEGDHLAIVGPVGSGKTSLLYAVLGEMHRKKGKIRVGGSIAYVSQEAWIQQTTVRENITFGLPFDEEKYRKVVHGCALKQDFEQLIDGDLTEIGEGGINLSGGQRQRIALARACYSEADLYLLDSPLSAVDEHTCAHLYDFCLKGILKKRTVLLVTHKMQYLTDFKVALMENGRLAMLDETNPATSKILALEDQRPPRPRVRRKTLLKQQAEILLATSPAEAEDIAEDDQARRTRKLAAWAAWVRSMGIPLALAAALFILFVQCIRIVSDYFLTFWTKDEFDSPDWVYIAAYGGLVAAFTVLLYFRGILFYWLGLRAARRLHDGMFARVLRAPMAYFAYTPLGVLLNCASKDQDKVDETLPDAVHMMLVYCVVLLTSVAVICVVLPYYTIVFVALVLVFVLVEVATYRTGAYLRSVTASTNSPIFAHISESFQGIVVLRAFGAQARFSRLNASKIDRNHAALHNLDVYGLFITLCLDGITCLLVLGTVLLCVGLADELEGSEVGLAISNSFQQLVFFTLMAKEFAQADFHIDSAGRIVNATKHTPVEPQGGERAEEGWPPEGGIRVCDMQMSYSAELGPVFDGLDFVIEPGTKVGVVGRTGSGKSSLIMCLFRMVELSRGYIAIDDVDIAALALEDLRKSLAIIPQESAIFKGTIRSNVDPFGEHTDEELWDALEKAHLKEFVAAMPNKLDSIITAQRDNFSLGQKQLFCVARAVLTNSKILVMDEATSAMDPETDAFVQQTVKQVFYDRTVITIAHRLDTIIDYDRILFLERGRILEYDTVENLLSDESSHFYALASEAGLTGGKSSSSSSSGDESTSAAPSDVLPASNSSEYTSSSSSEEEEEDGDDDSSYGDDDDDAEDGSVAPDSDGDGIELDTFVE